jgi:hypothetical protein
MALVLSPPSACALAICVNRAALQEIYFTVWPEGRAHLNWPDIAYFVVRPRWIR